MYACMYVLVFQWITGICALANGKTIVSASWDNTLRVWDARNGECLRILEGHKSVRTVKYNNVCCDR